MDRETALEKLDLPLRGKNCLYTFNSNPDDFKKHLNAYSHLERDGYRMVYSTNYQGGLFPIVDYYNAFDHVICAASYNQFWEIMYFRKTASFENISSRFSSSERRIRKFLHHRFDVNGADEVVNCIVNS